MKRTAGRQQQSLLQENLEGTPLDRPHSGAAAALMVWSVLDLLAMTAMGYEKT